MALHFSHFPKQFLFTQNLPRDSMKKSPQWTISPHVRCSATEQILSPIADQSRRSADYQPTLWSYGFFESLKKREEIIDDSEKKLEKMNEDRKRKLEDEVKRMLHEKTAKSSTLLLEFIDDIQRLGLGYRFEKDIKRSLDKMLLLESGSNPGESRSLHRTALRFRILRQHGYKVSQEVFQSFTNQDGHFKASLTKDVKGMLSLYEASYLGSEGESLLSEAMAFTKMQKVEGSMDKKLRELVDHAMELPLHQRMPRLEARWYIEAYNRREAADDVLLELAILDFNMVQSTLQVDLHDMSRWWNEIGLSNKLHFARDRLMECFFWTVGMVFEPEFSNCRKGLTKVTSFITIIDDIYDVYGSMDELKLFTDAVVRWDINMVNTLPDYMKLCFLALYNSVNEMTYDTLKEQGHNILPYLTKAWADLCEVFLVEAKWRHQKHTPTFEEYLENGWRSVSGVVILIHAYFLVSKNITKGALECLENDVHDLLRLPSTIFRLCNDLATSKAELERGESANSISCYMQQTGVSEEGARKHMRILIDDCWKKMNKVREMESNSPFGEPFVETAFNLARIAQYTYQYGDSHGAPDAGSKKRILSLIIEPISLNPKNYLKHVNIETGFML